MKLVRALAVGGVATLVILAAAVAAEPVPFKLGTFRLNDREFLGLVLNETRVVEISAANAAFQKRHASLAKVTFPADMKQLIAGYDAGLGARLAQIASAESLTTSAGYTHADGVLRVMPPVQPAVLLNAGANYPEHLAGIQARSEAVASQTQSGSAPQSAPPPPRPVATPAQSAPGLWDRPAGDTRPDNPYLFLKSPSVVVGANDDVVAPNGREQIDFECEFAIVVGKPAKNVSSANAADFIFGYTIEFDVSDRGGRGDRKMGGAPDWLVQKNHDTFGPIGPYIVPKAFMPNPMSTRHYFALNGQLMQDSNTSRMAHSIYELLSYASNIMTLNPGDMISAGSPAGTNIERVEQRWMRPGDVGICTVDGVGVQRHKIVAQR